ncbi:MULTISPECIES: ATP-dependent endonuclease [unclassified Microbacterium]|uniref:ATP-dependent nuclease n=1 Tax=unclassified Microbacterium TaxID=2609290 RepID=UPI000C2BE210|nr:MULTISPECIES: ATP-binding protein [unclassified Microbacterium]
MRITDATVGNYRSIGKQTHFALSDLTTLIGPNNEGKSNLLRSLALGLRVIEAWGNLPERLTNTGELSGPQLGLVYDPFHPRRRPDRHRDVSYDWSADYPLSKQGARSPQPTVVRITFSLTEEEVAEFREETGLSNNGTLPIELKFSRSKTSLQVVKPGRGAAGYTSKAPTIAKFVSQRIDYVLVPAVRTMEQAMELLNSLATLRLNELARTDAYRVALRQVDELRSSVVESVQADLKNTISTYLSNVSSVELIRRDVRTAETINRVVIDDGSPTSLAQKGDGVKSLFALALIQHLANQRVDQARSSLVLLVDEPEAHLHSRAVHDLLALFTKIARQQQVVLATHNPIFVNRESIAANVLVRSNAATAARTVQSIREVMGVELHDNLDSAEVVVLTEGWTDAKILPAVLAHITTKATKDISSGRIVFKAATGTGKIGRLIQRERSTACRILAVLDGDAAGDAQAQQLHDDGVLDRANIFVLRDPGRDASEIEDLINPSVYLDALKTKFGRQFKENQFKNPRKKWSQNFVAAASAVGLSGAPADLLKEAKMVVSHSVSHASSQSAKPTAMTVMEALSVAIWNDK